MLEEDDILRRAHERVGRTVRGKWRLDALLGVGGMAAVYAATHRNGNRVAVKWLHPELAVDKKMRERFVHEGYIANRVGHEGVVRVIDDEVAEDGGLVLFMELLQGETVDARWQRSGQLLPPSEAIRIGHAVLDVLVAAHAAGIVHRDLKPENLFLTHLGTLKVLDFGIARLRELTTASFTGSQSSLGTPAFMPPEQARGRSQEVDARSDIWAVGATLFTLLSGRYVHVAETVNELLLLAMTQPAPALATVASHVPIDVARIVDKALAFKPSERWQTAAEMRDACGEAFRRLGNPMPIGDAGVPGTTPRDGIDVTMRLAPNLTTGRPVASVLPVESIPSTSNHRRLAYRAAAFVAAAILAGGTATVLRLRTPTTAVATGSEPVAASASMTPSAVIPPPLVPPPRAEETAAAGATPSPPPSATPPSTLRKVAPSPRPARPAPTTDWHDRRE